ncbi:MAG: HypC/HybG/HupF family hydrogenase formation chaperone [Patescibacteria group bacterium]|nr:HypC/HybG/HupF family hydrogenase formation chaperone [Patescibacteria group bacterium]
MCLATPIQIKEIKNKMATVDHGGKEFFVSLQLIPQAKVGDWILAHGEIGISILPEREALDILSLIQESEHES